MVGDNYLLPYIFIIFSIGLLTIMAVTPFIQAIRADIAHGMISVDGCSAETLLP
jgi:hypothetical protein